MLHAALRSRAASRRRAFLRRGVQPAESLKALAYFKDGDLAGCPRRTWRSDDRGRAAVGHLPAVALRSRELAIPPTRMTDHVCTWTA